MNSRDNVSSTCALPFVKRASLSTPTRRQKNGVDAKLAIDTPDASYDLPCEIRRDRGSLASSPKA